MPRVAVLSFHTSPLAPLGGSKAGGMNAYIHEVVVGLGALGWAIDVFTRRESVVTPEVVALAPGVRLVHVPAGPAEPLDTEALASLVDEFAAGIEAFRQREDVTYDLAHSHYWLSVAAGELLARRWDVKHLAMFHTLAEVKLRARASEHESPARIGAERRLVHQVDRVVAATAHERQLLRQIYRVPAERVAVIPLGVDLEVFRSRDAGTARAALGIAAGARVLLAVGRLEPLKGFDILIRALAQLTDDDEVILLLAGGDERSAPERERLEAVAREVVVADRVRFLGAVPHQELAQYYNAADVVVVPSFYESFGLVALEAMASGVPVVASRVGGLVATISDGRTGYLVPWRCPEPFAEKLDLLLRNEPLRRSLGAAARASMERYAWSTVAERLAALYEEVLTGAGAPMVAVGYVSPPRRGWPAFPVRPEPGEGLCQPR
ncbi:MAG: glycosyltransferase family 1 protein [Dehalococcoidia bacterium]|nr:glycosyltransferase family 1 protein [Dehalococcoidia bacterium]